MAAIPHKSKSYRVILDLSFNLLMNSIFLKSVNETTQEMALQETMVQLGLTLKRLIATMADNYDLSKPFQFCKLDQSWIHMELLPRPPFRRCYGPWNRKRSRVRKNRVKVASMQRISTIAAINARKRLNRNTFILKRIQRELY